MCICNIFSITENKFKWKLKFIIENHFNKLKMTFKFICSKLEINLEKCVEWFEKSIKFIYF